MLPEDLRLLQFSTLKHFWNFDDFRYPQKEIIDCLMCGNDTMVLLPTGAGKSLCYQLPALLLEGVCLVVSPLVALMRDQVDHLLNKGIGAAFISSDLEDFQIDTIFQNIIKGTIKLLYVSPERLSSTYFLNSLQGIQFSFFAIDEAHCISEWGQDFRPGFQNIKKFRLNYPSVPCIALTATATPKVLKEIISKLDLKQPSVFQSSFKRENIKIFINKVSDKYRRVYDIIKNFNHSGIVYVRTREEAVHLSDYLKNNGFANVDFFHAGLSSSERKKKQKAWSSSNHQILVATNAFGMGIDKDNVRFVIHLSPPSSIENYYQEIGRAGRDGMESYAFLLYDLKYFSQYDDLLKNQIATKSEFLSIISYLYSSCQIADAAFSDLTFEVSYQKIQRFCKVSFAKIKSVLQFLHNQEIIYFQPNISKSVVKLLIDPKALDLLSGKDSYFLELLIRTLPEISSQKVYFMEGYLASLLDSSLLQLRDRLQEMHRKEYIEYSDGTQATIRFLLPRQDYLFSSFYWNFFQTIQINKIRKWEEVKFFVQNNTVCKMKLILSYFGEKSFENCNACSVCDVNSSSLSSQSITDQIISILKEKPSTIEEIYIQTLSYSKELILENLIYLLDKNEVKMLNFRTYSLV